MSFKKNYIASLLQTFLSLLFPIVTFPYVSRVLGPESIGRVEYALSITYYFTLFMHLGIPLYATREVAKVRDDKESLSNVVSEITCLYLISSLISTIIFYVGITYYYSSHNDYILYLIAGTNIFLTSMSYNWFIQGVEKHRYLSVVNIGSKIINLAFLFLFIKNTEDYVYYLFLSILTNIVLGTFGTFLTLRSITFRLKGIKPFRHVKSIIAVSGISIADGALIKVSTLMLGSMGTAISVGVFAAAFRFLRICEGMITILSKIAMPRISNLVHTNDNQQMERQQKLIFDIICSLALPATVGVYFVASEVILIFAGKKFLASILVLQYLSFSIFTISISTYVFNQVLFPLGYNRWPIFVGTTVTLITAILTYFLIPNYGASGAAIGFSLGCIIGMILNFIKMKKVSSLKLIDKNFLIVVISSSAMAVYLSFIPDLESLLYSMIIKILGGIFVYGAFLVLCKHDLVKKIMKSF